jgi:putative tryptophan/tyrosine transport system substrate-binding protein
MRRRDFIKVIAGGAAGWPLTAGAQRADQARVIGVLENAAEGDRDRLSLIAAFRQRLDELGWSSPRMRIDVRWTSGDPNRLRASAEELVGLKPAAILGGSTPVVAALQKATDAVPIVFVNANDPLRFGFVASMARPGGNITGFVSWDGTMGGKWLEILKEVAPQISRAGLINNPQTYTGQQSQSIAAASQALGLQIVPVPFQEAAGLERGVADFASIANGGLLVLPDISTVLHGDLIPILAARHRLPAVYPFRVFVNSGGLVYYGTNTKEQYRRAAEYVDRILRGEKPGELPVQAPTRYELVINLKTAKALGLTVPPTMLTRADEVIE